MGLSIIENKDGYQVMYCNTTMWAFGPVFYEGENIERFLDWLGIDPKTLDDNKLESKVSAWRVYMDELENKGYFCDVCDEFYDPDEVNWYNGDEWICPSCNININL